MSRPGSGQFRRVETMFEKRPTQLRDRWRLPPSPWRRAGWAADNSATADHHANYWGATVNLPPLYEPTIQSIGALTAVQTGRPR